MGRKTDFHEGDMKQIFRFSLCEPENTVNVPDSPVWVVAFVL